MATPTIDGTARYGPDDDDDDDTTRRFDNGPTDPPQKIPQHRQSPEGSGGPPPPLPTLGIRQKPWRKVLSYPVLYAMAAADAFGFWNTLSQIIKRDATLVLVFVFALAIGAVAVPHVTGQLLKSRLVGYGGSLVWMGVLCVLWLSLGGVMAWLRWSTPTSNTGQRSGALADTVTAAGAKTDNSMHIALLLLVLFLLTGALAMTHGYRFGDPRSAELRTAIEQRARLEAEIADHRLSVADAEGDLRKNKEDQQRARRSRNYDHEIDNARIDQLRNQVRQYAAAHLGDPESTDTLHNTYPKTQRTPRSDPQFNGPAEID